MLGYEFKLKNWISNFFLLWNEKKTEINLKWNEKLGEFIYQNINLLNKTNFKGLIKIFI